MTNLDEIQNLDEIINEISECREDERSSQNQIVQIISTAGTILGVILGAAVFDKKNIINENILFLLSCFIFGTAFSYIATLGIQNVLRYHYIQKLEDQLAFKKQNGDINKINFVQWMSFSSPITTRNPSHLHSKFAVVFYLSYTIAVLFATMFSLGVIGFLYYKLEKHTVIDTIVIVVLAIIIIIIICFYLAFSLKARTISDYAYNISLRKKRERIEKGFMEKGDRTYNGVQKVLKIFLYFFYPKYKDLQKAILIIVGYFIGVFLIKGYSLNLIKENFSLLILSLFVIDFLIYQARYLWNDIRGVTEDVVKTDRLPIISMGKWNSVIVSLFVICIRYLIAIVIFYKIRNESIFSSLCLNTVLILILSALYEWARTRKNTLQIFFLVSLGYPMRVFVGICAACPKHVQEIINSLTGYIYTVLNKFKSVNMAMNVDETSHFSIFVMIMFLLAYAFMGAFSVILPWLYESIEEKRKGYEIRKKHYLYLLEKIEGRYKKFIIEENGDATTLICSKGKITDLWNLTYILSVSIFSVLICWDVFHSGIGIINIGIVLLEVISIITSIVMCTFPNTKKEQNICLLCCGVVFVLKIFLCYVCLGGVLFYFFVFCNQIFFSAIYWFIRYHFRDDFNFVKECKKLLKRIFIVIISKDTWEYLHK